MGAVRRLYVEKKRSYAVAAGELEAEIKSYLGIRTVDKVRILIRYDLENVSDAVYQQAVKTVFAEPPVDDVYEETFEKTGVSFSVEYLPGQFDQRADSAEQCLKLLNEDEEPIIRTATTYIIEGKIRPEELEETVSTRWIPESAQMTSPSLSISSIKSRTMSLSFRGFQVWGRSPSGNSMSH